MTLWHRVGDAYACAPAKCGSTSFRAAMMGRKRRTGSDEFVPWSTERGLGPWYPDELPDDGLPRYLAVRDPVKRFVSLVRHIHRPSERDPDHWIVGYGLVGMTPRQIFDYLTFLPVDAPGYEHWRPQCDRLPPAGAIPVPYHRLLAVLGLPRVHVNANPSSSPQPERVPIGRLRHYYAADLALWRQARKFDEMR